VLRGVDRHEHHPVRGRALTEADMRAEIVLIKQLNFDTVRTSHYPTTPPGTTCATNTACT